MDSLFKIYYFFPHELQDLSLASPLNWYTPGLHEAASPMKLACTLPVDIREAHSSLSDVLMLRLKGYLWPSLLPIQIDTLTTVLQIVASPFIICFTTSERTANEVDRIIAGHPTPILHISTIVGQNREPLETVNLSRIGIYIRRILAFLKPNQSYEKFLAEANRILLKSPQRKAKKHNLSRGFHNIVAPNEIALMAFGYKLVKSNRVSLPIVRANQTSVDNYVSRICKSADAVTGVRDHLLKSVKIKFVKDRAVLAVTSVYWGHYQDWREIGQQEEPKLRKDVRRAMANAVQATTYFDQIEVDNDDQPIFGSYQKVFGQMRARDMKSFTAGLSMLSSATLCPVLRLEPKLNQIRGDLKALADCIRSSAGTHYRWKLSRLIRKLNMKMRNLIHQEFLNRIDAPEKGGIEGMKLVADLPLELMSVNGLPLGLRFDVSRISPIPGNLFWQTCALPPITLEVRAFQDILIIRSFNEDDPIRFALQNALATIAEGVEITRSRYRFVDVATQDEFVNAVKSCTGAVLIFDGHGTYDASLGVGSLVVGGKALNTWGLRNVCKMPPVVMFSACDTQPIDGSHGSVATSVFALGAFAVLGTILPVDARDSGVMLARMLLRLDMYLPIASRYTALLTWRHVVSGMLRMSHTVEVTRILNARAGLNLSVKALGRIQLEANNAINSMDSEWNLKWIGVLAEEANKSVSEIKDLISRHAPLTDAMKYIQMGVPERIIIRESPIDD